MSWPIRYMALAHYIAQAWSKDPKKKVGAVITLDNYPIGLGVNGFPRGIEDTPIRLHDKVLKNALTIHAEKNALARAEYKGDTCYVTYLPCTSCLSALHQAGIKQIFTPPQVFNPKWNWELMFEMAEELGVSIVELGPPIMYPTPGI